MGKLTPPRMLILSFLCAIILGTILLSLPVATKGPEGMPLIDSLFTATSATCVTGLIVRETGAYFSTFGKWVIFALFQMGGLGIMTFSTLFGVMLGRKISLREGDIVRSSLNQHNMMGLRRLLVYIICITFTIEAAGALALFFRWHAVTGWPVHAVIERAVFHSVSGFCNAGFSLFRTSFVDFAGDPVINIIIIALIVAGGIGFVVIMDLIGLFIKKDGPKRLSLQSKIVLSVSAILIVAGMAAILLFEKDNTIRGLSFSGKLWSSFFQSVTARTTGFNSLPIDKLAVPSMLVLILLMFIGASPGSTGGGIKTCTFAVIAASVWSMMKNRKKVMLFGRSVPHKIVRESLLIFFLSAAWIFIFTLILVYLRSGISPEAGMVRSLFEVVSAFGTVGLSAGVTETLDTTGKLCIIVTMFAGRVGPLTLAMAVALKKHVDKYTFPEENIMVG